MPGAVYESWSEVVGPTVLRAESIAVAVLPALSSGARGTIHSAFRRAVNLTMADGTLVAILAGAPGRVPNGVHVDGEVDFLDPSHELRVGQGVEVEAGVLRLSAELLVDLRWAPPWSLELSPVGLADAARLAANRRRARGRVPVDRLLIEPGRGLARAVRRLRADEVDAAVRGLVGLGPGLTPAGDDLLLGYLAVLRAADHPAAEMVAVAIVTAAPATGPISATLLRLAAEGQHAELIGRTAVALLAGDELDVEAALDGLLVQSSASASSAAYGAVLALDAVARGRAPDRSDAILTAW